MSSFFGNKLDKIIVGTYAEYFSLIGRLPKGEVFTCVGFSIDVTKKETIIKALYRMVGLGKICTNFVAINAPLLKSIAFGCPILY